MVPLTWLLPFSMAFLFLPLPHSFTPQGLCVHWAVPENLQLSIISLTLQDLAQTPLPLGSHPFPDLFLFCLPHVLEQLSHCLNIFFVGPVAPPDSTPRRQNPGFIHLCFPIASWSTWHFKCRLKEWTSNLKKNKPFTHLSSICEKLVILF